MPLIREDVLELLRSEQLDILLLKVLRQFAELNLLLDA